MPDRPTGRAKPARPPANAAAAADPVGDAFRSWVRTCSLAGWTGALGSETVHVTAAHGRVTAEAVRARWPVPAYRAAAMDGIAVRTSDCDPQVRTHTVPIRLSPGNFDPVDTGNLVPADRDAVVMREHVTFARDGDALISRPPAAGQHIRPVGEDIKAGAMVLPAGHRVRAVDTAAVAAAGHASILVRRRPIVAIVPTGNEIRAVGTVLAPGEILDTNSIMLTGLLEDAGCTAQTRPIVPDSSDEIAAAVLVAARTADLVLVLAGSSAGRDDHTSSVIAQLGHVAVHGVAMRPGHPVVLGVLGGTDRPDEAVDYPEPVDYPEAVDPPEAVEYPEAVEDAEAVGDVGEAGIDCRASTGRHDPAVGRSGVAPLPARPGMPATPVVGLGGVVTSSANSEAPPAPRPPTTQLCHTPLKNRSPVAGVASTKKLWPYCEFE